MCSPSLASPGHRRGRAGHHCGAYENAAPIHDALYNRWFAKNGRAVLVVELIVAPHSSVEGCHGSNLLRACRAQDRAASGLINGNVLGPILNALLASGGSAAGPVAEWALRVAEKNAAFLFDDLEPQTSVFFRRQLNMHARLRAKLDDDVAASVAEALAFVAGENGTTNKRQKSEGDVVMGGADVD